MFIGTLHDSVAKEKLGEISAILLATLAV